MPTNLFDEFTHSTFTPFSVIVARFFSAAGGETGMNNNYFSTLIAVAEDCPVTSSRIPDPAKPTIASFQHAMLVDKPRVWTQEDVLFETSLRGQTLGAKEKRAVREAFFSRPTACLRASPLAKMHGFGFLFDEHGCITLLPVESQAYGEALHDPALTVVKAMRSKRAKAKGSAGKA